MSPFDPSSVIVGGVYIAALVFGITQFIKELFNLEGKAVTGLAVGLGFLAMMLVQVAPEFPAVQLWLTRVLIALAFALAAPGYYKFIQTQKAPQG